MHCARYAGYLPYPPARSLGTLRFAPFAFKRYGSARTSISSGDTLSTLTIPTNVLSLESGVSPSLLDTLRECGGGIAGAGRDRAPEKAAKGLIQLVSLSIYM